MIIKKVIFLTEPRYASKLMDPNYNIFKLQELSYKSLLGKRPTNLDDLDDYSNYKISNFKSFLTSDTDVFAKYFRIL